MPLGNNVPEPKSVEIIPPMPHFGRKWPWTSGPDGWPTSDSLSKNRVPHISILRCGHSRNARTALLPQLSLTAVARRPQERLDANYSKG